MSHGINNNAVQTAPSELAEDSTSGRLSELLIQKPAPDEYAEERKSKERSLSEVPLKTRQGLAQIDQPEYTGSHPESGEAIVVGPIGSAAPWFLTGWAHDVDIEFMIDTGCQVTILSTTVFQRMCAMNPEVCSALQTCQRRLVSADSSPLTVQGQLELDIVFPGLCCKMLFVVANIGSDGLLGTEALQSYLPHQLDLRTGQLWADGWSTLQLHQQRLTPDMDGLLTTSVVIPPDSEIVAKFSVSGTQPNGCVLVEPARHLIEEYGIIVGHTLVDASSGSGSVLIVNQNAEVVVLPGLTFSLFAVGGVLSQLQKEGEVVIAYASRSLRLSQRRYCTNRREMLAAIVMCTHFRSYLRGEQFTLRTDHSSLRWLQRFRNGDGMLAHWYLLLGQFSVTFVYRPGAQHANADGMSHQCGQCQRPDCPVSAKDSPMPENNEEIEMVDQPFAASEIGESMDADLLPELSGKTWVASGLTEEFTADLLPAGSNIAESRNDDTLAIVRGWIQSTGCLRWVIG